MAYVVVRIFSSSGDQEERDEVSETRPENFAQS